MSERRFKVYIAGPYSKPEQCTNTHKAMVVWDSLFSMGFIPFCPHWTHFQHTFRPRPYEDWMAFDLEWLRACDVVYRLPGESAGADREVAEAVRLGIPVVIQDYPGDHYKLMVWAAKKEREVGAADALKKVVEDRYDPVFGEGGPGEEP